MKRSSKFSALIATALAAPFANAAITDPGDIAGLVLWLDAGQGVTESGGSVSQWDDLSGAGNHVSQGTSELRPTLVSSATPNGSSAISFSLATGTGPRVGQNDNDFLSSSALQLNNTMTAFFVMSPDSTPTGNGQRFAGHYGNGQFRINSGKATMHTTNGAADLNSPTMTAAQFQTLAYRLNNTVEISIDGSAMVQTRSTSSFDISNFLVGGVANTFVPNGAYGSYEGDFAGIIIYDAVLTDAEVADVNSYINTTFVIPEPGAFSLLALGGLGLILRRRR